MEQIKTSLIVAGKEISIESGKLAKQANGACVVRVGDTMVLVTAVASSTPKEGTDFMPLTVDYKERAYSTGRFPGGFFKREAKPKESEILVSRLIDRSIRPLFSEFWRNDTQIVAMVISHDGENPSDIISIIGASVALHLSNIPFEKDIASVRIGRINGEFVVNPTIQEREQSDLDLVVSGTEEALTMVEAGASELSEQEMLDALNLAKEEISKICKFIKALPTKEKLPITEPVIDANLKAEVEAETLPKAQECVTIKEKTQREVTWATFKKEMQDKLAEKYPEQSALIDFVMEDIFYKEARKLVLTKNIRTDGRALTEIRPITCEVGYLPRAHGSAIFTRGQTQSLATVTLGSPEDKQVMDELTGEYKERFLLHYNFPGYATGEPKPERSPGRREIGHGNLARRGLKPVLPEEKDFPYAIRIVSDITESNGSSSMASVCGGCLALLDAGVPIKATCAGIAMGLMKEGDNYVILTDIMGMEDHLGDMDFKVVGTRKGITALQMDIKIDGLTTEIMAKALEQARVGRMEIIGKIEATLPQPRPELSKYAPRMVSFVIPQSKIGTVIGPGGKTIKGIQETTGVEISIEEDGTVFISSPNALAVETAKSMVEGLTAEVEVGKEYKGKVTRIMNFGAFVEILPGKEGLVHISKLSKKHVKKVEDVVSIGEEIVVKVDEIDKQGRINLSKTM
ncbi:polyribonucleotide nucleotidyltransferase [Candidatus Ruminimicrobiellum ovillum]|uniref:polyribonucleotide nucleotidyltransferase n=1 Tax=Candidatus Ruminimicrobiellum ovillum TaxID=1947927 RepID=UPI00355A98A4